MSNGRRLARVLCLLTFAAASPLVGQPAHLVRDIVTGNNQHAGNSDPANLTAFGAKVAFTASEESTGREVWVTDSESRRTYPLANLCRGPCSVEPEIVGTVGSTLFFIEGRDQFAQRILWASDGTARGTHAVLDDENVVAHALLPTRLVFLVNRESSLELWSTDGTPGGTTEVAAVAGSIGSPVGFVVSGNRAFLLLRSSPTFDVWSTDGTTGGTRKLAGASGFPSDSLRAATTTHLFFVATTVAGQELWASDGTAAGTRAISSFAAPEPFESTEWLKPIGKRVYFFADDITHGRELWRSDGTPQGTMRITEFGFAGAFEDVSNEDQVEELGGKIVFFASDGLSPLRLWTSTGSPASTRVLSGVCSDPCSLDDEPWLRRLGNRLYFPARSSPSSTPEIWFTDGTAAGSGPLVDSCAGSCVRVSRPRLLGGRLYFLATTASGRELWSSDGTTAGTREVSRFEDPDPFGSPTPEVVAVGGRIWFAAGQQPYGQELWSAAETPESTELAADIGRGGASSDPARFAAFGDRVLFVADRCHRGGYDLWVSDGGVSTQRLSPFVSECLYDVEPAQPIVVSGPYAYFWRGDFTPLTLWRTDGTAAGTIALATPTDFGNQSPPLRVDGGVAFSIRDDSGTWQLWRTDGTVAGTTKRLDLPGPPEALWADGQSVYFVAYLSSAQSRQVWRADLGSGAVLLLTPFGAGEPLLGGGPWFTKLGSQVYFWLRPIGHPTALWRTDGSPAGTAAAFDLPAAAEPLVFGMSNVAGSLYFQAGYPGVAYQLWRTDGSAAGTTRLGSFTPTNPYPIPAFDLAAVNGKVFFVADDLAHGRELWSTDGTPEGTGLLRDIIPGTASSSPLELTAAAGRLFFTAADAVHARELWQSDGTALGTRLVHDIAPDVLSGEPTQLTVAGPNLFFAADDGLSGREPWVLPLAGTTGCVSSDTVLCLGGGRFRVEAVWRDFADNVGIGHAASLTSDTGTFWFFSPSNVEVIVKVLDGRGLNNHRWVFYGALSSVEYTLTVTDTQMGAVRRYFNPTGRLASVGDTEAFGPRGASALRRQSRVAGDASPLPLIAERRDAAAKTVCVPSATRLCLAAGRFALEVAWRDFAGNTGVGTGTALSSDTGDFWFFSADNVELVVKILDGRPVNGKFWLFYGALSSVEYTLTVTDTATGTVRTYTNPSGRLASVADTAAF